MSTESPNFSLEHEPYYNRYHGLCETMEAWATRHALMIVQGTPVSGTVRTFSIEDQKITAVQIDLLPSSLLISGSSDHLGLLVLPEQHALRCRPLSMDTLKASVIKASMLAITKADIFAAKLISDLKILIPSSGYTFDELDDNFIINTFREKYLD